MSVRGTRVLNLKLRGYTVVRPLTAPTTVRGLPYGRRPGLAVDRVVECLGLPLYRCLLPGYPIPGLPSARRPPVLRYHGLLDPLRVVVSRLGLCPLPLLD